MFLEPELWEQQFYKNIPTPYVPIPLNDIFAFQYFPKYNWVYNKIKLMETQNITCYPHGIEPRILPVFSKPIINLWGMSIGAKKIDKWDYSMYQAGHFLMPFLEGEHYSIDVAIVNGIPQQYFTSKGIKDNNSSFLYWITNISDIDTTPIEQWISTHLNDFTGMVNFELIGSIIIECHLRLSSQFIDLFGGDTFLYSVKKLYEEGTWKSVSNLNAGISYIIRLKPGTYTINENEVNTLRNKQCSIQLTHIDPANDCFTSRVAIINSNNQNVIDNTKTKLIKLFKCVD